MGVIYKADPTLHEEIRLKKLLLSCHGKLYLLGKPIISDKQYDDLDAEIKRLEKAVDIKPTTEVRSE